VTNPEYWDGVAEDRKRVEEERAAAQSWSTVQIDRAVRRFLFETPSEREGWDQKQVLESLGDRTHPTLSAILRDATVRKKLTVVTGTNILPEAPLNRLCGLLDENPPETLLEPLMPFLDHPSDEIRKSVALVLANIGATASIEPVRKTLLDGNEYVRSSAMIGLSRAVKGGRLAEACKRELFPDLQRLVRVGQNVKDAAELLLKFDRPRASEFLSSAEVFTVANETLYQILDALAADHTVLSREELLALIGELGIQALDYRKARAFGEALQLLGELREPTDRPLLEQCISHENEYVAKGAATGLLASHGLSDVRDALWSKEETAGFLGLTAPQQHYLAISTLDAEVNNGGHSQYFLNSSGDQWREALAGLEAIGAVERATIFREAIGKFGPSGPSFDRRKRMDELARLVRKDDAAFDAQDERWYKSKEPIEVMLSKYVLARPDAFK
jgi:HEAT repeat protein